MATKNKSWGELDQQLQEDLLAWYNRSEPTDDDKAQLAKLYGKGQFHSWDCPRCGDRVCVANPDDWGDFQGVLQADYASYPGDDTVYQPEYIEKMCDTCRSVGCTETHVEEREEY
jgi:hypothetical protein